MHDLFRHMRLVDQGSVYKKRESFAFSKFPFKCTCVYPTGNDRTELEGSCSPLFFLKTEETRRDQGQHTHSVRAERKNKERKRKTRTWSELLLQQRQAAFDVPHELRTCSEE